MDARYAIVRSTSVALPLEVEVEVQGVSVKDTLEALLMTVLPLPIQDPECEILQCRNLLRKYAEYLNLVGYQVKLPSQAPLFQGSGHFLPEFCMSLRHLNGQYSLEINACKEMPLMSYWIYYSRSLLITSYGGPAWNLSTQVLPNSSASGSFSIVNSGAIFLSMRSG